MGVEGVGDVEGVDVEGAEDVADVVEGMAGDTVRLAVGEGLAEVDREVSAVAAPEDYRMAGWECMRSWAGEAFARQDAVAAGAAVAAQDSS